MSKYSDLCEFIHPSIDHVLLYVITGAESGKGLCGPGGGGYSIYPWVGRCGSAPHTLTLLKTKIADFPTLFKTEFRFLIPSLRHS